MKKLAQQSQEAVARARIARAYSKAAIEISAIMAATHEHELNSELQNDIAEAFAELAKLALSGLAMHPNGRREECDLIAVEELATSAVLFLAERDREDGELFRRAAACLHGRDSKRGRSDDYVVLARHVKNALYEIRRAYIAATKAKEHGKHESEIHSPRACAEGAAVELSRRIVLLGGRQLEPAGVLSCLEAYSRKSTHGKRGLAGVVAELAARARLAKRPRTKKAREKLTDAIGRAIKKSGQSTTPEKWERLDGTSPWSCRAFTPRDLSWVKRSTATA